MKKYKLLKDLPGIKAGCIFTELDDKDKPNHAVGSVLYAPSGLICPTFSEFQITSYPDFFEPVNEWPKTFEELQIGIEVKFILPAESKQLDSIIAFTKLTHITKAINGKWVPDWDDNNEAKYTIIRAKNKLRIDCWRETFFHISFHSREAAEFSLEHHRELWEQYYMISK